MASHHKGEYPIINGSDREAGGIRRGPKRIPRWQKALNRAAELLKREGIQAAKKEARAQVRKHLLERIVGKSHHKGCYRITNGSDHDKGGIRRGPRRGKRGN